MATDPSAATQTILERNQKNARYSTGPKTPEGKAASSHNSFKHGLTGLFTVADSESREDFERLYTGLEDQFQPANEAERICVQNAAQNQWLVQRSINLQSMLFSIRPIPYNRTTELAVLIRYQASNQRAFHKSIEELRKLQKERRQSEAASGSVSQPESASGSVSQPDPDARSFSQSEADEIAFIGLRKRYSDDKLIEILLADRAERAASSQNSPESH